MLGLKLSHVSKSGSRLWSLGFALWLADNAVYILDILQRYPLHQQIAFAQNVFPSNLNCQYDQWNRIQRFATLIQMRWDIHLILILVLTQQSLRNFAHGAISVVPCAEVCSNLMAIKSIADKRNFHRSKKSLIMMTSSNGNIFRGTGHLCGEFTGLRWISRTKASDAELWHFLWSASE